MKKACLCISVGALHPAFKSTLTKGLYRLNLKDIPEDQFHFVNRAIVDSDTEQNRYIGSQLVQVLPYVVLTYKGQVLTYARSPSGGEAKLHGLRSIGFGGHIDIEDFVEAKNSYGDAQMHSSIAIATERELDEELGLSIQINTLDEFKYCLIDTTNPVGQVHMGSPVFIEIDDPSILKPNHEILDLKWVTEDQLQKDKDLYEGWSQILIEREKYHD